MNLRTNAVQKKRSKKSTKVINLERTKQLQYSRFKSKIAIVSFSLVSFLLIVGGIVYFLMGQAKLNILNDRILKKTKKLKLKEDENKNKCIPEKCDVKNTDDLGFELDDKVEIF